METIRLIGVPNESATSAAARLYYKTVKTKRGYLIARRPDGQLVRVEDTEQGPRETLLDEASGKPVGEIERHAAEQTQKRERQLAELRRLARANDVESQFQLARVYFRGDGVARDLAAAREWYERAAAADDARAIYALGRLHEDGLGVPADPLRAAALYTQLGNRMHAARARLGILFARGKGVPRDTGKAWEHLRAAALAGEGQAVEPLTSLLAAGAESFCGATEAALWRQAGDWVAARRYATFLQTALPILGGQQHALRERSFQYQALLIADEYRRGRDVRCDAKHALWWYEIAAKGEAREPAAMAHEAIGDLLGLQSDKSGHSQALEHYAQAESLGSTTAAPKRRLLKRSLLSPLGRLMDGWAIVDWRDRLGVLKPIIVSGLAICGACLAGAFVSAKLLDDGRLMGLALLGAAAGGLVLAIALLIGAIVFLRGTVVHGRGLAAVAGMAIVVALAAWLGSKLISDNEEARSMAAFAQGNQHFAADRFEAAEQSYDAALALRPAAIYHLARGNARLARQRYAEALNDYNRAIERVPDLASAYLARGTLHWLLGRNEAAEADYRMGIYLKPDDSFYYERLAAVLAERNGGAEAAAVFRAAFTQDRSRLWALGHWFGALYRQKHYDEIMEQAAQLRRDGVRSAWLDYFTGMVLDERKSAGAALNAYLRAVAIDPYGIDLDVYQRIALIYKTLRLPGDCLRYLREYVELLGRLDDYSKTWCQT